MQYYDPFTGKISLPDNLKKEVKEMAKQNANAAIQKVSKLTGANMQEAKKYVDSL